MFSANGSDFHTTIDTVKDTIQSKNETLKDLKSQGHRWRDGQMAHGLFGMRSQRPQLESWVRIKKHGSDIKCRHKQHSTCR
jgi:hypothetical protein